MIGSKQRARNDVLDLIVFDKWDGQTIEVTLRFVDLDGRPHVLFVRNPEPKWVATARSAPFLEWRIEGETFRGIAKFIDSSSRLETEILPNFVSRFGSATMSDWFGGEVNCVQLIESQKPSYYDDVEALFDRTAADYDRIVEGDRLNMHLRDVSQKLLRHMFPPGSRVLEVGCGTGLETIPLAQSGVEIVAVDLSRKMLEELNRKARSASVSERIESRRTSASGLKIITDEFGPGTFDGAFSHYGALNCEPRLDSVPIVLYELMKPQALVSLGILNRTCLSEMVLFSIGLQPRRALARLNSPIPANLSRFGVSVFAYGPADIEKIFASGFRAEGILGVSVTIPPPQLGNRLRRHGRLLSLLERADESLADRPFFRCLGDYFLMALRRR